MSDTLSAVIAIGIAVVLIFVVPVMTMADRTDDIAQLTVNSATTAFVDECRKTRKITPEKYNQFIETINSTGNLYATQFEISRSDENMGKKTYQTEKDKTGENAYIKEFTSQVLEKLDAGEDYLLKEGDLIAVVVRNTTLTPSQQFKNFFMTAVGNNTYTIAAEASGLVS